MIDDDDNFIITDDSGLGISGGGQVTHTSNGNVPASGGSVPTISGGGLTGGLTISGSNFTSSWGIVGTNGASITATISQKVPITSVMYLLVFSDNSCLELQEQNPITPREMIGLCKFINMVQFVSQSSMEVNWEELMYDLGISRHFVSGRLHHNEYVDEGVFYVKLFSK
jgi:hypothetical protein